MKYAVLFLMLAAGTSTLAIIHGGWWHILHWFALSFLALSAGHAWLGPCIFGKKPDGRLPIWSKIFHLPFYLYTNLVWIIISRTSSEPATNRITDDLIVGRRLRKGELPADVVNCLDLTSEFEEPADIRTRTHYINLPILDAGTPRVPELHKALSQLEPGTTYIHCAQGHGRTGLVAMTLLARRDKHNTPEELFQRLTAIRPGIALNRAQWKFVKAYLAAADKDT